MPDLSPMPSPFPEAPAPALEAPVPTQVATTELAPQAHTAVNELAGLLPKDGTGGNAITVLLALIAVAGGGAGWKFYQSFAKQKHEQRMKELELKEKRLELQDDKHEHKACEAARAADRQAFEAKIGEMAARLAEIEKAKSSFELPLDPDEINQLGERLEKLEKALKAKPRASSSTRKS